jgi:antitoxin component YwqK of YwqJK toxin-antitoxin module
MLITVNTALFAQVQFSLSGHLASNFSSVTPTIGFEVNFGKIDILVNANFWISTQERTDKNYQTFNTDSELKENRFEIFAGIAPKVGVTDKISLTFPVLAKVSFRNGLLEYDSSTVYSSDTVNSVGYLGYGLDAGARAYFYLNPKWDIYAGFLFEMFSINNNKYSYWKTSPTSTYMRETKTAVWFDNGEIELGVRFKV